MGAKYGQHFLINQHAAERIAQAMELGPDDCILEIGPGKGSLTAFLLKAKHVAIVEIDPEMVALLRARFGNVPNIHLIQSDILKFDFSLLVELNRGGNPFKVVGNLPYNLTSPILRRLSDWDGWATAFVMVQKEVADRLCASAGSPEYGALTVGMSLTCRAESVFELSGNSFNPRPKVKSAVVKLIRREKPLTVDIDGTQRVIQAAFQQRRKTILNSLSHGLGLEKSKVEMALKSLGVESTERPERLPVETFIKLAGSLKL
jgi:16S rRNA (adenine1518-N6/adenine1519-N6)-dimethyltransferase